MDPGSRATPPDPFQAVDERERERRLRAVPAPAPAVAGDWSVDAAALPSEPGLWPGVEADGRHVHLRTHAADGGRPDEAGLREGARCRRVIAHQAVPAARRSARAADGRLVLVEDRPRGRRLDALLQEMQRGRPPACLATQAGRLGVAVRLAGIAARAHAAGVVHASLAPDVVLVTDDGELFVDGWPPGCPAELRAAASRWAYGPLHYQPPEVARGEPPAAAGDVYAVAAIAHHLLVGRPPLISTTGTQSWLRKTQGIVDPLSAVERAQVPEVLAAVLALGLAAEPGQRPEAAAFADALERAADACLALAAQRQARRRRWPWLLGAAAALVAAAAGAWMAFGPEARWDGPALSETFAEPSWPTRWRTMAGGFERVPAGVGTVAGTAHVLACEERMSPQVAVEYDARMAPGATAGDLSFKWLPTLDPGADGRPPALSGPGIISVQIGAYDNRYALIEYGNRLAQAPLTLESGRVYRVRVELDGERIELSLDGRPLLSASTLFPLPSGHPALYGYYAGKEFGNVRIRSRSPRPAVSPLAVGDAFFSDRLWASAQLRYREVAQAHAGTPLGEAAQFRLGLSHLLDGDVVAAGRAWRPLAGGAWQPRIDLSLARHMLDAGEWTQAQRLTESVLARSPALRAQALELWTAGVDRRTRELQCGDADRLEQTWRTLLGGDRMAGDAVQRLLLAAGRHERVLADADSAAYPSALSDMGRTDEVMRRFPLNRRAMISVLLQRGEFARLVAELPEQQWAVASALICLDRIDDIPRLAPLEADLAQSLRGIPPAEPDADPAHRLRALLVQERYAEAEVAARGLPLTSATVGLHAQLACAVGRSGEFAAMLRGRGIVSLLNEADLAIAALAAGDAAGAHAAVIAYLDRPGIPAVYDKPLEVCLLPALVALRAKGADAAREFLAQVVERRRYQQGQRPWHIAALALGRIDAPAFRAQPMQLGLAGDEELALALAAELAGDVPGALARYRAWSALPAHERSVSFPVLAGRLVAQRIGELSAAPR